MTKPEVEGKEIAVLQRQVTPVITEAQELVIESAEDMNKAAETLSVLNQWNDRVVKDRERITKPMNEVLKEVRGRYKPLETMLETVISDVRRKISAYQTEAKRKADEEAARIAERVGEGKGKLKVETAVRKIDEIVKPEEKVSSDAGIVKFKTVRKFEVVSLADLPLEYHLADETAIRNQLKAGTELKGVRYWNEEQPINFR